MEGLREACLPRGLHLLQATDQFDEVGARVLGGISARITSIHHDQAHRVVLLLQQVGEGRRQNATILPFGYRAGSKAMDALASMTKWASRLVSSSNSLM